MPAQNIHIITEDFKNLQEASEAFAILQKQFRYLQEHIDVENIIAKSLTAAVIAAGAITTETIAAGAVTADTIAAGAIQTDKLAVGAVTADKIKVEFLSAITAELGKIISGEIYGTYIATSEGTYPRAELSSVGDFFRALASANVFTEITPSFGGAPALHSTDGVTTGLIQTLSLFGGTFVIMSTKDISLKPGTGNKINIPSWSQLYSDGDIQTLAEALNNLATAIAGKADTNSVGSSLVFNDTTRLLKLFSSNGDLVSSVTIP